MKRVKGGITAPKGFFASSLNSGIKKSRHDLGLLFSETPATAAAVFTKNKVKAAPVIVSQRNIRGGVSSAVIVNSGNANCCTGARGIRDAEQMASSTASGLSIAARRVLVASTGVIGKELPVALISKAIPGLIRRLGRKNDKKFARAIMTTDTFPKSAAVKIKLGSSMATIGGVAKGAGMIQPDMATMLSFITTDAAITKGALKEALGKAVNGSFNAITVDGSTSTNDCVFILANGKAENKTISKGTAYYGTFCKALKGVLTVLAKMIVVDGEGATKFIHIIVKGARNASDAKKAAASVANDPLFKTSAYGEDPNWGRIAAAVGCSGAAIAANRLDIYLDNKKVLGNGVKVKVSKEAIKRVYKKKDITVVISLKRGKAVSEIFTCDLTHKYVDINANYTT